MELLGSRLLHCAQFKAAPHSDLFSFEIPRAIMCWHRAWVGQRFAFEPFQPLRICCMALCRYMLGTHPLYVTNLPTQLTPYPHVMVANANNT